MQLGRRPTFADANICCDSTHHENRYNDARNQPSAPTPAARLPEEGARLTSPLGRRSTRHRWTWRARYMNPGYDSGFHVAENQASGAGANCGPPQDSTCNHQSDCHDLRLAAAALDHPGGRTEDVGEKALTGGGTKADSGRAVETLRPSF